MKYYYCFYDDGNSRILKVTDDIDCLNNEAFKTGSFELSHLRSIPDFVRGYFKRFYNYLEIDLEDGTSLYKQSGEAL